MFPFFENKADVVYCYPCHGLSFPVHMHVVIEMLYVLRGEITVTLGKEVRTLKAGGSCAAFPNQVHGYETQDGDGILVLLPLSTLGRFAGTLKGKLPKRQFLQEQELPENFHTVFQTMLFHTADLSAFALSATAQLAFALYLEVAGLEEAETVDLSLPGQAISFISENYRSTLTLSSVATHLNVSKCYASRLLHDFVGMGFCEYLNRLRIDDAKNMLHGTSLSVTQIALECGFETLRSFNRAFQAICQTTPREYRKMRGGSFETS